MGIFFNRNDGADMSGAQDLLSREQQRAKDEKARTQALLDEKKKKRMEAEQRSTAQQGGGRTGLMYGGSETGVA